MAISVIEFLGVILLGGLPVVLLVVGLVYVFDDLAGGIGRHSDRGWWR
jgi:hypothetical protein